MIAFGDFDVLSCDCYGTLIDWETGLVQALHPILQAHGVQQGDEEVLAAYAVAATQDAGQEGPPMGDDPADDGAPPWLWPLLSLPS
jgi:hypothetical protein